MKNAINKESFGTAIHIASILFGFSLVFISMVSFTEVAQAQACTQITGTPVSCNQDLTAYGVPANYTVGSASYTYDSCTYAITYTGGCSAPVAVPSVPSMQVSLSPSGPWGTSVSVAYTSNLYAKWPVISGPAPAYYELNIDGATYQRTDTNNGTGGTPESMGWVAGSTHTAFARACNSSNVCSGWSTPLVNITVTPPVPTATITANGKTDLTVDVMDTVTIAWNSTSTDTWASTISSSGCADTSLNVTNNPWIANTQSGTLRFVGYPFRGCTIVINYIATNSATNQSIQSPATISISSRIPTTGKVVTAGEQVRLRWNAQDATSCSRSNNYTPNSAVFSGSTSPTPSPYASTSLIAANVSISTNYMFTLTCSNSSGISSAASVGLTINPGAPGTCVASAGTSCTRSNSCGSITNSGAIRCDGTCSATAPSESGCTSTPPTTGTTTTGDTGTNGGTGGTISAPVCVFSASPSTIVPPQSTSLEWTCANANSCSINNGIGSVNPVSNSTPVSPTSTTIYTLSCVGSGNTTSSFQTTVRVTDFQIREIAP